MRKGTWKAAAVAGGGAWLSMWLAQSLAVERVPELAIGAAGAGIGALIGECLFLRATGTTTPKD